MKYLENISYTNINDGIDQLKKTKFNYPSDEKEILFHVYWHGKLERKQLCCIYSYLATQDLYRTQLWVWLDYETYDLSNKIIPNHKNIKIKKYIPNNEAQNTPFINYIHLNQNYSLKFRSDIARILFLYNYGGVYFDLDMILLKDLLPLLGIEFCYSWSNLKKGNNGLLRLKKGNGKLMDKYLNTISPFNLHNQSFFLGYNHRYIFTEDIDIMCFPCVMFDPVWVLMDTKTTSNYSKLNHLDGFFKYTNEKIEDFFDGEIYAYHWHSRNNQIIEKASYFEKFEKLFMDLII